MRLIAEMVALSLFAGAWGGCGAEAADVVVHVDGAARAFVTSSRGACLGIAIPDAPARAFRTKLGLTLFATDSDNWSLSLDAPDHWRFNCGPALISHQDPIPSHYDDKKWIAATWADASGSVLALVHHELQAYHHPGECKYDSYEKCWYNTITFAYSNDEGRHLLQSIPPAVVAAPPIRQEVDQGHRRGFFNPSNIIQRGAFWYFYVYAAGWNGQGSGSCIFRTRNINDPSSWRAFDGKAFAVAFPDPYIKSAASEPTCATVDAHSFGSVVRLRGTASYVASIIRDRGDGTYTVALLISDDLIRWRLGADVMPVVPVGATECTDRFAYPALFDVQSRSRNFDEIGLHPQLVLTRFNLKGCTISLDRDLVAFPLTLRVLPDE